MVGEVNWKQYGVDMSTAQRPCRLAVIERENEEREPAALQLSLVGSLAEQVEKWRDKNDTKPVIPPAPVQRFSLPGYQRSPSSSSSDTESKPQQNAEQPPPRVSVADDKDELPLCPTAPTTTTTTTTEEDGVDPTQVTA